MDLTGHISRTRLVEAPSLTRGRGDRVFLKLESEQPTGSFKVRGALHALAANIDRRSRAGQDAIAEVVASSTGNHGAAVAWAARRLGVRATIFLPRDPNPVKKANILRQGAAVVEHGADLAAAFEAATAHASRTGAFFLNDATEPDVPEGAAVIAAEVIEEMPDVQELYVPVGDTALIRGIAGRAKALKPAVRIVGVQAEPAPSYYLSWREGRSVSTETANTIADGLATRTPVDDNVHAIRTLVDDMRLVSDAAMIAAVAALLVDEHIVAEPSAAASVAAYLEEPPRGAPGRVVVLLITGCNVTADVLRRAIG
jgi:threonine dehydratase